jgi:radical SAM protein with 4Fe4S-binding SPASM domain
MKATIKPRIRLDNRPVLQDIIPLSTPLVVFVDPASACNFKCTFCPTGHYDLISKRFNGLMKFDLFRKIIDDLTVFEQPIKVLRMYKDGEPFLNKNLAKMVAYARQSKVAETIDTTTNGSLIDPFRLAPVLEAGLDRINISVDGMDAAAYQRITKTKFDFDRFIQNIKWLFANKGNCLVHIKTIRETLSEDQEQKFLDTFGDYCDEIFVENFSPCWPAFDGESRTGWNIKQGLYGQSIQEIEVCPYIFYTYCVNADGLVSSCSVDWDRKLIIGDVNKQSMKEIWTSEAMEELRRQHLRGERSQNETCGKCRQLNNCMADNIDSYREDILWRMSQD